MRNLHVMAGAQAVILDILRKTKHTFREAERSLDPCQFLRSTVHLWAVLSFMLRKEMLRV